MMDDQQLYNNKPLERLNRKLDQNLKEIEKQRIQDDCRKTINKTMLPEDRFSDWIHSICLVTFDIEIGQRIEVSLLRVFFFISATYVIYK